MKTAKTLQRILIALHITGLLACGARQQTPPTMSLRFTDDELALIGAEGPDAPMKIVFNDSAPGDTFLRGRSGSIDPTDPSLQLLLARMMATVKSEKGVGIAAPQIGVHRRIVIVKRLDQEPAKPYLSYINPRITARSDETALDWEGCLSIPAGFAQVRRAANIEIDYDRPDGKAWESVLGFTARIFQHEIDHLDGVLFIDRKEPGELMPETQYREMRARQKHADEQS